jgi:hypothetical protein
MAGRIENQTLPLETYGSSPQEIAIFLVGNGSSAPTVATVGGAAIVSTIVRASTGVNTVTLTVPINQVIYAHASPDDAASPDGSTATVSAITGEGTSANLSFKVNTFTSGSLADMASGRKIRILLRVRKSNWGKML